jgi:hypothetical protein
VDGRDDRRQLGRPVAREVVPGLVQDDEGGTSGEYPPLAVALLVELGLAFSPTDAMPLAPWAKLTMAVQALISFSVLGLVIARAVNTFA